MARISGTKNIVPVGNQTIATPGGDILLVANPNSGKVTIAENTAASGFYSQGTANVGHPDSGYTVSMDPNVLYDTTDNRKLGSAYFAGGLGIEKDLNVGGFIYGRIAAANTATTSSQIVILTANDVSPYYLIFAKESTSGVTLYEDVRSGHAGSVNGTSTTTQGLVYYPDTPRGGGELNVDRISIVSTETSTGTTTGALQVKGGASVSKDITVGGAIYAANNFTDAYLENIYTNFLGIGASTGTLALGAAVTDVFGDIRVRGKNPIGTAPAVSNVLYVTTDGNDTNDGRAQDAGRACRTISGAIRSPYYQSGTQIRVSAGKYLEDNPIQLKPYTSISGSDLRTCSIEPINKTQDLFHMNSGCYLSDMQFINGRSGLLEGAYAPGYNRGAYCTAFPPLPEGERIDLFHSPYIQNCTNLSGPWLKDGTMFVPNQTVQVPTSVGIGSWPANVTTLTVTVTTGTIVQGMSINAGQQNQGFFNARTLLLANKRYLQDQVVKYVNNQVDIYGTDPNSIWYEFKYSQEKCFRDVGILIENCAYDAAFGGNEKSVESGLAYYKGVVSLIAGQELQTTAAIEYLRDRSLEVIQNITCTNTYVSNIRQIINTVLIGGAVSTSSIASLFGIITSTIADPANSPEVYRSTGPDAAFVSAEILLEANRAFIQEQTLNYINYNLVQPQPVGYLPYNKIKYRRDTEIIIDSVSNDLLFPTPSYSQSTFAGSQYRLQDNYVGTNSSEITTTTNAVKYLRDLAVKIIKNITPNEDLVNRYQDGVSQVTNLEAATAVEAGIITSEFNIILDILGGKTTGWSNKIVANGLESNLSSVKNAYDLLLANEDYLKAEVIAYIDATKTPGFVYDSTLFRRNIGYMINSVAFDLLYSGNRQAIQSGLSYNALNNGFTAIPYQGAAIINAVDHLRAITLALITGGTVFPLQNKVKQITTSSVATIEQQNSIIAAISTITNIIANGVVTGVNNLTPISLTKSISASPVYNIIQINKKFLIAEVIAYIDQYYNLGVFTYDQDKCFRDTGLLVDAVSQDILLGGNQKSIESGLSYWNQGYNSVAQQLTTTTLAINYISSIAQKIIKNEPVTVITGTSAVQIINPFFNIPVNKAYMPTQAIARNFNIITDIISKGPGATPPKYEGGGVFALTGINGADVKIAPVVTSVELTSTPNTYLIGLDQPTVGFGNNSTLYFGDVSVYPKLDAEVEKESLANTGNVTTWNQRKLDPIGAMGGSLVDGAVISDISPIQSFVYDAYTQVNQGGKGICITNNGYAQLVSVFTIFCSTAVQVDNGGIASVTNSNSNFGDLCLVAKGYGKRDFSGTVFNPLFRAYPFSPATSADNLDQYYPSGYWPNRGTVEIFVPDVADRPHISLVMEVIPPDGHLNEQTLPGFLNAQPSTGTLVSGSIVLENISTTDVAIGNNLFIRDQYGYEYDHFEYKVDNFGSYVDVSGNVLPDQSPGYVAQFGVPNENFEKRYAPVGTLVTDVNYNSITLNQALTLGGGDPTNPNFFTLYFCGNSYYTVLSSTVANSPYKPGTNILSQNLDPNYQGPKSDQISAHDDSLAYLSTLVNKIIANESVAPLQTEVQQAPLNLLVSGGENAQAFIDLRFSIIRNILTSYDIASAESVVPAGAVTRTGTIVPGAGSAVTLIINNLDFLASEVSAYVIANAATTRVFDGLEPVEINRIISKCKRDTKVILQRLIYDLETGGTYNSVMAGLSYWARVGTHHIVELGEAVSRTDLFPDGATANFYQRSYISASGYLFEYVGAGTNYGSLPQVGRADPIQSKETVQLNSGKVFFTSTDQNGDFRIGPGLVISQATGVLSGRTFTQSLFANMTPFILAIEGGGF
jgi:hypothetical protein